MVAISHGLTSIDADTRGSIARTLWLDDVREEDLPAGIAERLASPKNSNQAFGQRMRTRLQELLDHPDSFAPNYKTRYETLMQHCDSLSPHQAYAMSALLGQDSARGYRPIPEAANFQFPAAHVEDLKAQVGWYFVVGSCTARDGREFGVEVMLFRYALLTPRLARESGLSDIENQVVELHFAVTDAGGRHHRVKPIVVAGTTGLLDYSAAPIGASMGKNLVRAVGNDGLFPLRVEARGICDEPDGPFEIGVALTLSSDKPPLLQGGEGCMPCCGSIGTLYYSIPDLRLDASASSLTFNGEQIALADGKFWFDHQWGTGMIPGGAPRSQVLRAAGLMATPGPGGWDWFMAQFEGDRELTFYSLHTNELREFYFCSGPTPPGTMRVPIRGKYMDPSGAVTDVTGSMEITEWVRSVTTPDAAQYPVTDTWNPNRWEYRIDGGVPDDMRRFNMVPIVSTGQSGFFAFGGGYSEGAVYLQDEQGHNLGRGFAESVLYADPRRAMVSLAGLPVSDSMLKTFDHENPSLLSRLMTIAYLAWPPNSKKLKQSVAECVEHGLDVPAPKAK